MFVACYTRHAFSRQARLRDQNIGDRQLVVDVLARADLIDQIAFELATESSAFAADVVHGAASVENWGTCRFARGAIGWRGRRFIASLWIPPPIEGGCKADHVYARSCLKIMCTIFPKPTTKRFDTSRFRS